MDPDAVRAVRRTDRLPPAWLGAIARVCAAAAAMAGAGRTSGNRNGLRVVVLHGAVPALRPADPGDAVPAWWCSLYRGAGHDQQFRSTRPDEHLAPGPGCY